MAPPPPTDTAAAAPAPLAAARRRTLEELNFPKGEFGGPVWCPHLHVLTLIPPCTAVDDVCAELRRMFPVWRQVHVEAIRPGPGFVRSVYRVARYGSKFCGVTEVEGAARRNWTGEEVALLLDWTARHSPQGRRGVSVAFGMADLRRNIGAEGRGEAELAALGASKSAASADAHDVTECIQLLS